MSRTNRKPHATLLKKLHAHAKRPQALIAAATASDAARHLYGLEPPLAEPPTKCARSDHSTDTAALMRRIAVLTKQLCEVTQQQMTPTPKRRPSTRSIGSQTDPVPELERYSVLCGEFYGQVSWDTHRLRRPILEHAVKKALERGQLRLRTYLYADYPEGTCMP
jgi:hypothetical protein